MMHVKPPRPALAFRAGITGARDLAPGRVETLSRHVRDVLALIRQELAALGADPETASAYGLARGQAVQPALRFLSPLARGADRLGAKAALAESYALYVPMPFPRAQYEQDFTEPADLAEFRALLDQASAGWLELDGDREAARGSAYEAVGRTVVRNCDLLLAIWDGELDGNGRGGTAETVRYAASTGVPIWWLHATRDVPPIWLADIQDLRDPRPLSTSPEQALREALGALIRPPRPSRRRRSGVTEHIAHAGRGHEVTPMAEYFARPAPPSANPLWRAHDVFMGLLAGPIAPSPSPRHPRAEMPEDPVAAFWLARFQPADRLAVQYADRYRSGFVWTFLFATLSVVFGAASLLAPGSAVREAWIAVFGGAELLMLLAVLTLVVRGIREDWHEHSIEFRLLAELCRKQQMLGPLGWTLPIVDVRGMTDAAAIAETPVPERGEWVAWLFAADQRAAPLPTGALADTAHGPLRRAILDELIADQLGYHGNRAVRHGHAGHRLAVWGEACFFTIFLVLLVKLCLSLTPHGIAYTWPLGLLATILPALSAAFVGIRAYSEAPLLAVQSRHMVAALNAARGRVERLGASRPLLSQDLGAEAASVATIMLQDLDGWARLFRVKTLEAG
jgi:hypothetical protein